jgi:hypothetical protein
MLVANENLEMSRKTSKWVGNFQVISTPISHPNPAFPTHFLFLVRCVVYVNASRAMLNARMKFVRSRVRRYLVNGSRRISFKFMTSSFSKSYDDVEYDG